MYSDGVTEAQNEAGEFFGDERLQKSLPELSLLSAREMGESVLKEVKGFVGEAKAHDDLSMMILKRKKHK